MNVALKCYPFVLPFLIFILLFSGIAIDRTVANETAAEDQRREVEVSNKANKGEEGVDSQEIQTKYDERSLLLPVLQYHYFIMSFDYFNQFLYEDDYFFQMCLSRIFGMERSLHREGQGYRERQGTVIRSKDDEGEVWAILKRALLKIEPDGSKWWQIQQTKENSSLFYEVLISVEGIPMLLRYIDPETGRKAQTVPSFAKEYEEAAKQMPLETLRQRIEEEREKALAQDWDSIFHLPHIVGEELIGIGQETFRAVHIKDEEKGKKKITLDYWISPDVPGNFLKIVRTDLQKKAQYTVELTGITENNTPQIASSEVVEKDELERMKAASEGSPKDPVEILIGEPYYGTVGVKGTSYYKTRVRRRADIKIQVSDFKGSLKIYFYGADRTFRNYTLRAPGSGSGASLYFVVYFVDPNTTLYFTVVNIPDESSDVETYTVTVTQDFILSNEGVLMRGEIYTRALELQSGDSYTQALNPDGLNYYKTKIQKGPNLRISIENLPEHAGLRWADTKKGSYSHIFSFNKREGRKQIDVYGLSVGTECFFYVAGDAEQPDRELPFTITLVEFKK